MKNTRAITALALIAAVAVSLGASRGARAADADDRIEASAKKTYVYRTYLKDDAITIEARDGVVTLTGTVADGEHKSLAEDTVKGLPGVTRVDNRLEVKAAPETERSDDWIGTKVKAALLFHRSVSANTQVHVKDGVVTLSGPAASQAQKDLTTEYAQDVEGVKEVANQMTITKGIAREPTLGEKIDDASITAQVKLALLQHRSTSALRTEVTTQNGVVTVSGKAKNKAEADLIVKLVRDINGVKDVRNKITIQE